MSDIEWTDATWNAIVGCSRVSPGCEHCYAERFVHRGLSEQHRGLTVLGKGTKGPRWTGEVRLVESVLAKPLSWRKPKRVFVNSLSDLFHEKLSNEAIAAVFGVMAACPHLTFQVLTKRPKRMREWFAWIASEVDRYDPAWETTLCVVCAQQLSGYRVPSGAGPRERVWPLPNVWLGVTAEDQQRADERIPLLLDTPAAVRFVSYEPALGPVTFRDEWLRSRCPEHDSPSGFCSLDCRSRTASLDWLIVGGESGPGARPFDLAWARSAVEQCKAAGVPVFVKQLGARPEHNERQPVRLRHRKGADSSEWPEDLRVRQFPGGAS